jgi:hypothetical protein
MPAGVKIGKLGTCCGAAHCPSLPTLGPHWRRPPESEDSGNERPHNKFRVSRFAAWLISSRAPEPPYVDRPETKAGRQIGRLGKRTAPQPVPSFQIFGLVSGRALEPAPSEYTPFGGGREHRKKRFVCSLSTPAHYNVRTTLRWGGGGTFCQSTRTVSPPTPPPQRDPPSPPRRPGSLSVCVHLPTALAVEKS